jgi:hypothetical protein
LPLLPFQSVAAAVGKVGNDVYPGADVPRLEAASWKIEYPDFVAFALQVRYHRVEDSSSDSRHILSNNPSGPDCRNNAAHFRPEVTVICCAQSLPGDTVRLARESSANNVNCSEFVTLHLSYVGYPPHVRPVFCQNAAAIVVNFHLTGALHAGPVKAQVKAADATKQRQVAHIHFLVPTAPPSGARGGARRF